MKSNKERVRLLVILGLAAAGAYGLLLHSTDEPTSGVAGEDVATAPVDQDQAERDLLDRFERFRTLRLEDDWAALYDLVAPEDRSEVDLRRFLNFYGRGYILTHDIQLNSVEFDWDRGQAITNATTSAELNLDALPSSYRVQGTEREDRVVNQPHDIVWVLRDGIWFWRLDDSLVRGRTPDGRDIRPLDGQRSGSASRAREASSLQLSKEEIPLEGSGDTDGKAIR